MARYRHRSREKLKQAIERGAVTIIRESSKHLHPGRVKPSFALHPGDLVQLLSIRKPEPEVNFDYKILYEDEYMYVIHKPANLPVHPAGKYFFHTLLTHLKTNGLKEPLQADRKYFLVHRIDKETSGLILLAKTREACNALTSQFRNRETSKYYLAIVHGVPQENNFTVDSSIGKMRGSAIGLKMHAVSEENGGLSAVTRFEVIESRDNFSLVACFPRTGRQHQIRAHADIAGHPLVGDKIYGLSDHDALLLIDAYHDEMNADLEEMESDDDGDGEEDLPVTDDEFMIPGPTSEIYAELEEKLMLPRHALHAAGLRFKHPKTEKEMIFEAELPRDLQSFFESITGRRLEIFKTSHW